MSASTTERESATSDSNISEKARAEFIGKGTVGGKAQRNYLREGFFPADPPFPEVVLLRVVPFVKLEAEVPDDDPLREVLLLFVTGSGSRGRFGFSKIE